MLTKKIFNDLAIFMIGFGIVIGVLFPFFVLITGTPASYILTPLFFGLCILAGIVVGLFNIFLSRKLVGRKLKELSMHMKKAEDRLMKKNADGSPESCDGEECMIKVESDDEIGESSKAFNALVRSLAAAFHTENQVRAFTEMLSSHLELDKLADESLSRLMADFHAQAGAILIEKEGDLEILTVSGIRSPETLLKNDLVWNAAAHQKRILLDFPEDIVLDGLLTGYRPRTVLLEPIIYKDITLGLMLLSGTTAFTPDKIKMMELFGHGLSLAFRNAITYSQLQRLAANDPLTGILNRRFGMQRMKEEMARSIRYSMPLGVVMFDIDHFKTVNDTYGHIVGDKVLVELSRTAKTGLREGDLIFRYGGEEFIVILPGASHDDVKKAAEQIRHLAQDLEVRHQSQIIKVTVSLGGTSFPERDFVDVESIITFADARMYEAKEAGRNNSIID